MVNAETVKAGADGKVTGKLSYTPYLVKGDTFTAEELTDALYWRWKTEKASDGWHDTTYGIFDFAEKANFIYNSPEYMEMMEFNACKKAVDKLQTLIKNSANPEDAKEYEEKINGMKRDIVESLGKTRHSAARAGGLYRGRGVYESRHGGQD